MPELWHEPYWNPESGNELERKVLSGRSSNPKAKILLDQVDNALLSHTAMSLFLHAAYLVYSIPPGAVQRRTVPLAW